MAKVSKESKLGGFVLALAALWAAPVAYSVHSGLPYNPIKLPFADKVNARLWAPQGWRFFTRDAQEEQLHAFEKIDGAWSIAPGTRNADKENWFGASRVGRAMHADTASLAKFVPDKSWVDCKGALDDCIGRATPIGVKSPLPQPLLCGEVALVARKPVPWAWSNATKPVVMPTRVARLEVKC